MTQFIYLQHAGDQIVEQYSPTFMVNYPVEMIADGLGLGGFYVKNGVLFDLPPLPEEMRRGMSVPPQFDLATETWLDPRTPEQIAADAAEALAAERAQMVCSPLQGQLVLGEVRWQQVEAILEDPETPWSMKVAINKSVEWKRLSQSIDTLAYLLQMEATEVDDLFRIAMTIEV